MQKKGAEGTASSSDGGQLKPFHGFVSSEGMVFGSSIDKQKDKECVSDSCSIWSLPWVFGKRCHLVDRVNVVANGELPHKGGSCVGSGPTGSWTPGNVKLGGGFEGQRSSIRSRRSRYSVLPLESQNCLIPQLYGDDFEMEEFMFSSVPPSSLPSERPFYIIDGSKVISKSSYMQSDSCDENVPSNGSNGINCQDNMMGISAPPEPRKSKRKIPRIHQGRDGPNRKPHGGLLGCCLPGTFDGMLLFCMGISIGATFTMVTKKREVDKLNDTLKQSESLVKDLQEELELKDVLTVKELVNESSERRSHTHISENMQESSSSFHNDDPNMHPVNQEANEIHHSLYDKNIEHSESFRKIEAELEAELERLELNMNKSSRQSKMPAFDEFDDQTAEVVQGELCEDKLNLKYNEQDESRCNSRGSTATWTTPVNYSVSPTELSLRLHELKQSRLEERIKELEAALAHSQRHLHFMKSDVMYSLNTSSDMGSSSTQGSPTIAEQTVAVAQPICINLSGDSLDAYNEAYDELMRISNAEEKPPTPAHTSGEMSGDEPFDSDSEIPWALGYGLGSLVTDGHKDKQDASKPTAKWASELRLEEAEGVRYDDDDNNDDVDDEEGRYLIQQIVERSRKGSPFELTVQQMLLSMDK